MSDSRVNRKTCTGGTSSPGISRCSRNWARVSVVQAGYVATRSIRQLGFIDINASQIPFTNRDTQPLFQKWGRTAATTFLQPVGTGHYDSLQASVERRFSGGFLFKANYTWGQAINFVDNSYWKYQRRPTSVCSIIRVPGDESRTHVLRSHA